MAALVTITIALGTLAFGAVYPWAYIPLFVAAALIGIAGLVRRGILPGLRPLALALVLLWAACAVQLVPLPRPTLDAISPAAAAVLDRYSLTFTGSATERLPLSVDPVRTQTAVLALGALGLYLLGLPALLRRHGVRALPRTLALFAVPLALFGMYSREYHNGLIYWFWQPQDGGGANQFGPFVNRNHFGGWMLMTVCLLAGWLFGQIERALPDTGARRQRPLPWLSSAEANGIIMTAAALLIAVISLFWTLSRSSMLSLSVAALALTWLALGRRRLGTTRRAIVIATVGAVLLAGVTWRGPDQLIEWFQDERDLLSRVEAWRDGWDVVRAFPLAGTGLNTYSTAMVFYQTRNPGFHMAQAHNDYLQLLAEGGLLVAIPAAIAVALLWRAIRRNLRAARNESRGYWIRAGAAVGLLAMAVQEMVEFSLQMPANALLFCTLAAVALTPLTTADQAGPRDNIA